MLAIQGDSLILVDCGGDVVQRLLADVDPAWSKQVTLPLDKRESLVIRPDLVRDDGSGWSGVAA